MHVQTNKHWKEVIHYLQDKITQEKVTPTLLKKIKSYPSYTLGLYILTAKSEDSKACWSFYFSRASLSCTGFISPPVKKWVCQSKHHAIHIIFDLSPKLVIDHLLKIYDSFRS